MTNKTQNGPGGCMCKTVVQKGKTTQAQPKEVVFNLQQQTCQKRAPFPPCSNILIPGLLAQTYNMKNVKHQATIPYIPRT